MPASQTSEFHDVVAGDTWVGIAARYGVALANVWQANGVANPQNLAPGQRIFIPQSGGNLSLAGSEIATMGPNHTVLSYVVQSGLPESVVLLINGFDDAKSVAPDQALLVPHKLQFATSIAAPPPTPTAGAQAVGGDPLRASRLGIQGYFGFGPETTDKWIGLAKDAGFTWVKYQVSWKATEFPPDIYPAMATLDAFMNIAERHKLNVLLSVVKAPDWARQTTELDGPPVEYSEYTSFVQLLASRYKGRLDKIKIAIEIWNEPNIRREWNGAPISAGDYVRLLSGAYVAIKGEDNRYTVVSAGLSPTGVNDGVNAVDDRQYLRQMYSAGLMRVSDAVGVHPYGWANPPRLLCCRDPLGPPSFNDDPRFFFRNTIQDYRDIQAEFGDSDLHDLWATEFGWGTMDGLNVTMPVESPWFVNVSADQQAKYDRNAFLMMQDKDYMGPMFLWNLNMSTLVNFDPDHSAYSIFLPPDIPRPAYNLIRDAPKIVEP